jgi:lactate dehydrogenase-like 2-hydroxyacid dehydrogenase
MKTILIMSKDGLFPNKEQEKLIRKNTELDIIIHEGKLSELKELQSDQSEKLLGVDPDSFAWDMDAEAIKNIPNVKAVFTQSTSFDWVKPKELQNMGVKVVNCAGFSTDAVAEFAIGMAMDVARHLPLIIKNGWKVDWAAPKPMLLKGKKLGVIGLGRIGTRIAEISKGMGMEVIYWSKRTRDKRFNYVTLNKMFSTADVIIPALQENEQTKKLLTTKLLKSLKPTSYLVGLNRIKGLWNEDAIIKMVEKGKLAGYAFEGENAKPLKDYKGNVLALPSMVWYTQDSLNNLLDVWVSNMVSFAKGKPQNVVA